MDKRKLPGDQRLNEKYRLKKLREKLIIHGESKRTSEYISWSGMKRRCYNINDQDYHLYGGRGIKVCKRWKNNYLAFLNDMGRKPKSGYSLDRINFNDNYTKKNTRWIDQLTQTRNRRGYLKKDNGTTKGLSWRKDNKKWSVRIGMGYKNINLGAYTSLKEAKRVRKQAELRLWV